MLTEIERVMDMAGIAKLGKCPIQPEKLTPKFMEQFLLAYEKTDLKSDDEH